MKMLLSRAALMIGSVLFGLLLSEGIVRLVRPDLAHLARNDAERQGYRIHANARNHSTILSNPDTGEEHLVIRNSFGLRQHREFLPKKPDEVIRIGFFGDSYTENRRIPAHYVFTEPLQHLFDQAELPVEILNFGTDGYGTDQVLLQFLQEGIALDLDHVVYLFCGNDLVDNQADGLFQFDENDDLVYRPIRKSSSKRVLGRLATTYLVMQAIHLFRPFTEPEGDGDPSLLWNTDDYEPDSIFTLRQEKTRRNDLWATWNKRGENNQSHQTRGYIMLRAIIKDLNDAITEREKDFTVLFLPKGIFRDRVKARFEAMDIPVFDTKPLFAADVPDLDTAFFESDSHWNQEGNKLVAVYLFRHLLSELGRPYPGDEFVEKALGNYYDVFGREPVEPAWLAPPQTDPENAEALRARILPLEANSPPTP